MAALIDSAAPRSLAPTTTKPTRGDEHSVLLRTASAQRATQSALTSGCLKSPAHFASASSTVHVPEHTPAQMPGLARLQAPPHGPLHSPDIAPSHVPLQTPRQPPFTRLPSQ